MTQWPFSAGQVPDRSAGIAPAEKPSTVSSPRRFGSSADRKPVASTLSAPSASTSTSTTRGVRVMMNPSPNATGPRRVAADPGQGARRRAALASRRRRATPPWVRRDPALRVGGSGRPGPASLLLHGSLWTRVVVAPWPWPAGATNAGPLRLEKGSHLLPGNGDRLGTILVPRGAR